MFAKKTKKNKKKLPEPLIMSIEQTMESTKTKQVMTSEEKEKMIAGKPYFALDPVLTIERARCKQTLHLINNMPILQEDGKTTNYPKITKMFKDLVDCKLNPEKPTVDSFSAYCEPPFFCDYGYNVTIGDGFYCNHNCCFLDVCPIKIGKNCLFGPNCQLYTAAHPLDPGSFIFQLFSSNFSQFQHFQKTFHKKSPKMCWCGIWKTN